MRIGLAGEGVIGAKHLAALAQVPEAEVVYLAAGDRERGAQLAAEHGVAEVGDLDGCLAREDIEAVILATPTPMHAEHAVATLEAGKHVLVEIPIADNLADAERIVVTADRVGRTAMGAHTRRFNPGQAWVHQQIGDGRLRLQHLLVDTLFLRRDNRNARGELRPWTDSLLWHHACHGVDQFVWQSGGAPAEVAAVAGPLSEQLGIPMDLSISLRAESGAVGTIALSFNNDGPFGSNFRFICDNGTYLARYDELTDGWGKPAGPEPVETDHERGIENQDREFVTAILEGRTPEAAVADLLPTMRVLDRVEQLIDAAD
ncbi:Gfo/Idh/MocA family oxidoreductase [Enemella evansiae]|uniref:Gfo/Idh/MocA family oxidoreductase n=1 Tax=Enemella evansiae TaxID=2016499 RepID=UPI000B962CC1|nr:Gfo/Idh/MocA family oxidoreductase [Enemella evansiae]OYO03489.1 oxidoreductase [Enemella evansiae]